MIARLADDWRSFHAQTGAVEIAVELPIACLRDPVSVATLCRQLPDQRAFEGLIIEIDAAAAVAELGLLKAIAKQLRFRNIAISIKNVRDEWLPLSKLNDFPFVELKIARELVASCAHDRSKLATCRHIIDLADAMGARTVAEGVDERDDFIALREIGVHLVQGGLFECPDDTEAVCAVDTCARDLTEVSDGGHRAMIRPRQSLHRHLRARAAAREPGIHNHCL